MARRVIDIVEGRLGTSALSTVIRGQSLKRCANELALVTLGVVATARQATRIDPKVLYEKLEQEFRRSRRKNKKLLIYLISCKTGERPNRVAPQSSVVAACRARTYFNDHTATESASRMTTRDPSTTGCAQV